MTEKPASIVNRGSLATTAPGRTQRWVAAAVMLFSAAAFLVILPLGRVQLPRLPAVIAAYEGALFICDLVTAVLVAWQSTRIRSRAMVVLTAAYAFDAAILVPHALSFPGMFSPNGLLGGGTQMTAWIYMFWHAGFPLFVIAYSAVTIRDQGRTTLSSSVRGPLLVAVSGSVLIAILLALVAALGESFLPVIIAGDRFHPAVQTGVTHVTWLVSVIAFLSLRPWRPRSILDLWLSVVMFAWMLDVGASALISSARFDLGFYAGRFYGLGAATFVLITLLLELGRIYEKLAAATEVEGRARVLAQIVDAQERERQRIARELHDEMGAYLTAMKVRLEILEHSHGRAAVDDLQKLLAQADKAVDTLALELRPPTLDDMGIDRAIGNLAERFTAATGIPVHVHQRNGGGRLPEPVETTLYRVVQEALTNVGKHSRAQTVSVILDRHPADVRLIIEDDGCGFDPAEIGAVSDSSGFGLQGMSERIRLLDGTISVESAPGAGTSVYVRVPVTAVEEAS